MRSCDEMAAPNKQPFERDACVLMIVDQQNPQRTAFRHWRGKFYNSRRRRNAFHRQNESGTAFAPLAACNERAAVRLGERFRNRQAETESTIAPLECALALLERVENATHDFGFDPDSGIMNGDGEELR